MPTSKQALVFYILIGLAVSLIACASEGSGLTVSDVWTRPSAPSALNSAFYMVISNEGSKPEALVAAESTACAEIQLHETTIDNQGVMTMRQQSQISIPSGGEVILKAGGLHLMCLNRHSDFVPGEPVPLTLIFEVSGEVDVLAEVRDE